jgi:hypothetical protein
MQPELSELREFLKDEFKKRKKFKPQYSKRAYSRDLGLATTSLNGFLAGKRELSLKNVDKVFKYLKARSPICCSWCGQVKQKSKVLIGGPKSQFICKDCVNVCNEIIRAGKMMP